MRTVLLAAVALSAMTSMAVAEPKRLAEAEMSRITAGFIGDDAVSVDVGGIAVGSTVGPVSVQTNVAVSTAVATALTVFGNQVAAVAENVDQLGNVASQGVNTSSPNP